MRVLSGARHAQAPHDWACIFAMFCNWRDAEGLFIWVRALYRFFCRYAGLLEATMEHVPSVCPIEPHELLEFCVNSGYKCRMEARGTLLIPPDYNVGLTDWERSVRLRCVMQWVLGSAWAVKYAMWTFVHLVGLLPVWFSYIYMISRLAWLSHCARSAEA